MDIKINNKQSNIDFIQLQKMAFLYNALENGWKIEKKSDYYIFKKKHEGEKEVYLDTYLKHFMKENFSMENFFQKK